MDWIEYHETNKQQKQNLHFHFKLQDIPNYNDIIFGPVQELMGDLLFKYYQTEQIYWAPEGS